MLNKILFKKEAEKKQKTFVRNQTTIKNSLIKAFLSISLLPDKAYMSCNAAIKSLYRIMVSKKHLLEWVTAEEAEKSSKNNLASYYINMMPNIIIGIIGIVLVIAMNLNYIYKFSILIISILWLIAPLSMYIISKPIKII